MNIYQKLFDIRHNLEGIQKDAKNPFFKSEYVTLNGVLDAINPLLKFHNILLLQPTVVTEKQGCIAIETVFMDLEEEDELIKISFTTELPLAKNDPQAAGSAITYARRYALMSYFSIKAEDDDGNDATFEDRANTYQVNEINKLVKELELEDKLEEILEKNNIKTVQELSKDRANAVLTRLREVKKERNNANLSE